MKTKIIIPTIIAIVLLGSFGYAVYGGFFSEPSIEVDKYPDCELAIFSGDDGVCLRPNQIGDLDWSSVETCEQTGKIIRCDPNVYPKFTEFDKPEPDFNPVPEPEPEPMPEENPETEIIQDEYVSPFDEELIQEFQQYHTVITGKVIEWYGQKEPSKYNYQYRVEPLAHHTPRMQEEFIYKVLGDDFIPVNADVVLFGLDMDDEGNLYIVKTVIQEIPEP